MIFKPTWQLVHYCVKLIFVLFFIFLTIISLSECFSKPLKNSKFIDLRIHEGTQPENNRHIEIVLPYYPFKHELTRLADSLYLYYKNQEALYKYKAAHKYFRKTNNWEGIAYTSNMMAEIYTNRLFDFHSAESQLKYSELLIINTFGEDHPLISDTYLTFGSYYGRLSRSQQEQMYLDKSLKSRSSYYGLQSIQVAEANYRIGQLYQHSLNENEIAKDYYNRAFTVFKEFLPSDHPDLILVYYALGSIYNYLEDFQRAIINIDNAIFNYMKDSVSNQIKIATARIVKANIFNKTNQADLSILYYESAIKEYEKNMGPRSYNLILAYLPLGVAYLRLHNYEEAIHYLDKAFEIYKIYYTVDNPSEEYASILVNKGECFTKLLKKDSSRFYLFKTLNVRKTYFQDDLKNISYVYEAIADMYNNFGQYDSALYYVQKALIELFPGFTSMDIYLNPEPGYQENLTSLIDKLALKAEIFYNKYQIDPDSFDFLVESLNLYNTLDQLSDNVRNSDFAEGSKLILTSDMHQIYGRAINCATELYQITKDEVFLNDALKFFEKNKYMLLFQNIEMARKSNELNIPFEYRFKMDSLQMLSDKITQALENIDSQSVSRLNKDRFEIDRGLTEVREEIEDKYPNYYSIKYDDLTIKLAELINYATDNNSLLMEYFMTDSNIYVLAISAGNVTLRKIARTVKLKKTVNDFLYSISHGQQSDSIQYYYNNYIQSAYNLYKNILFPVLEDHNLAADGQIIIAPDGILAQVPFEALIKVLPESEYPNYTNLDYLIHSYDFSYVYSFNLFFKDVEKELEIPNKLLAFSYSGIKILENPEKRANDLIELPGTNREIESIKRIVKGKNLFFEDEDATETQFKINSKDYTILHLAVHGIGDYESSINSRLVFKSQKDSLNDGNLFLYELYNVDLNQSKLAILSACETGIGKEFKGEGVFSIARGFAHAGCPSIIMSLWKVNDMVSAELMAGFYKNLKKGKKINDALRASKIKFIYSSENLSAHPWNWAALVPLGQINSIYDKKINPILIGFILIVIISTIVFIYYKYIKNSTSILFY